MRQNLVIAVAMEGRPLDQLRELGERLGVGVREVSQAATCKSLLASGGPSVLVLKVGRHLEQELALLEEVSRLHPDARCVVVGDSDAPAVAGLAWDLGARYVLMPPQPVELLPEVVRRLLPSAEEA